MGLGRQLDHATQRPQNGGERTDPMREEPRIRTEFEAKDDGDECDHEWSLRVHGIYSEEHHERRDVDADHGRGTFVLHEVRASRCILTNVTSRRRGEAYFSWLKVPEK